MGKPAERVSGGLNDDGLGNSSIKSIRPTNLSFGLFTFIDIISAVPTVSACLTVQ